MTRGEAIGNMCVCSREAAMARRDVNAAAREMYRSDIYSSKNHNYFAYIHLRWQAYTQTTNQPTITKTTQKININKRYSQF